jgi:mannose-6-phosphate isomerase
VLAKLSNQPIDYAWGSRTLISDYFGIPATGEPMAEIWFGTHDGSPTQVQEVDVTLKDLRIARGKPQALPYLLKILAAEKPLSIQAHPNPAQAIEGFARENNAGIALTDPNRSYKDDKPKPEMIYALSESFDALVGFADPRLIIEKFTEILEATRSELVTAVLEKWIQDLAQPDGLRKVFLETLSSPDCDSNFISEIVDAADQCPSLVDLVTHLTTHHGLDRGIVSSLLLNHVSLRRGEAIFVPAGMPHAYLQGLGIEVMVASDNVLRGGLTPKHIDVKELAEVLVFEPTTPETTKVRKLAVGLEKFEIPTNEFDFYHVQVGSANLLMDMELTGDAIILCTSGAIAVSSSLDERVVIDRGEAAYLSDDARVFSITGNGEAFMAISSK